MPDTSNPDKAPTGSQMTFVVAELSDEEYHDISNEYLNDLLEKFETLQDDGSPIDVEYSVESAGSYQKSTFFFANNSFRTSSPAS